VQEGWSRWDDQGCTPTSSASGRCGWCGSGVMLGGRVVYDGDITLAGIPRTPTGISSGRARHCGGPVTGQASTCALVRQLPDRYLLSRSVPTDSYTGLVNALARRRRQPTQRHGDARSAAGDSGTHPDVVDAVLAGQAGDALVVSAVPSCSPRSKVRRRPESMVD
jgi:hypothetical protein